MQGFQYLWVIVGMHVLTWRPINVHAPTVHRPGVASRGGLLRLGTPCPEIVPINPFGPNSIYDYYSVILQQYSSGGIITLIISSICVVLTVVLLPCYSYTPNNDKVQFHQTSAKPFAISSHKLQVNSSSRGRKSSSEKLCWNRQDHRHYCSYVRLQ